MIYTFNEINKDVLLKLYSEFGFTAKKIGDFVGITEDAILKRLKKYGIPTNPKNKVTAPVEVFFVGDKKKKLSDEILKSLHSEGKTDSTIGRMYGMTGEGVAYRRKKLGLGISKKSLDFFKEELGKKSIEDIKEDYYNLNQEEFSKKYNVSKTVWRPYLRKLNITPKSIVKTDLPDLNSEQKSLIIGGLLGDGGIDSNLRYYESHSLKQEQYLRYKMRVLEPYTQGSYPCDNGSGLRFYTIQHEIFFKFRENFYREDVKGKLIPLDFIRDNWNEKIIAYWFMDDGYYDDVSKFVVINNYCPIKKQLSDFINFLEEKLGWGFQKYRHGLSFSKRYYKDFFEVVMKISTPDILYKIPEEFLKLSKITADMPVSIHPKFYRLGSSETKEKIFSEVYKIYWGKPFPYSNISESRAIYLAKTFKNNPVIACNEDILNHNTSGMGLCDNFFPNIYECSRKGNLSPVDAWKDTILFKRLIYNRLKYADRINDSSMRKGLKLMNLVVSNFKPTVAKYIYFNYCNNGKVFDYSGGFGSRMLAAMSLGLEYTACEPNTKTYENLLKFGKFLKANIGGNFNVLKKGSEMEPYKLGYFGLAFSSPPYFDYESYSLEKTQSIVKYPELSDWLVSYWEATVLNSLHSLNSTGVFGACLSPNQKEPLIERTINFCKNNNFNLFRVIKVPFKHVLTSDSYEVILLFSKDKKEIDAFKNIYNKDTDGKIYKTKHNKRSFPLAINKEVVQNKFKETSKKMGVSRETYKDASLLGVPSHVIEHAYGSWNTFVRAAGLEPGYVARKPVEHVRDYFKACNNSGQCLSFSQYEKVTGNPCTRLKRLFNKGKPYSHLKQALFSCALDPEKQSRFIKIIEN